jgi:hypothetical protein
VAGIGLFAADIPASIVPDEPAAEQIVPQYDKK